jgi:hypothetical protein
LVTEGEGFLVETENGKMLSPETLFRNGFKTIFKKMRRAFVSTPSAGSESRCGSRPMPVNS